MIWTRQATKRPLAGAIYFSLTIASTSALSSGITPPPTPPADTGGTSSQLLGGGDSGRRREYRVGTRTLYAPPRERKADVDAPKISLRGHLDYALTFSLSGSARATVTHASGQLAFTPIMFTLTGSGSVDERPAIEEEAFWLGYLLSDE